MVKKVYGYKSSKKRVIAQKRYKNRKTMIQSDEHCLHIRRKALVKSHWRIANVTPKAFSVLALPMSG